MTPEQLQAIRAKASNLFAWYAEPFPASTMLDLLDYIEDLEAGRARQTQEAK